MKHFVLLMLTFVPLGAVAQTTPAPSGAPRADPLVAFCANNPRSALCTARLKGAEASGPVDLAVYVARGEADGTTAVTRNEIIRCWGAWQGLRDHVARRGRGTLPARYTVAYLSERATEWKVAVKSLFEDAADAEETMRAELDGVAAEIAGPKFPSVAERSGSCHKLPRR